WNAKVHGTDRLTPYVVGYDGVPGSIITAGTLHMVSVDDFQHALDQLTTFSSNLIADRLRSALRDVRRGNWALVVAGTAAARARRPGDELSLGAPCAGPAEVSRLAPVGGVRELAGEAERPAAGIANPHERHGDVQPVERLRVPWHGHQPA